MKSLFDNESKSLNENEGLLHKEVEYAKMDELGEKIGNRKRELDDRNYSAT